MYFGVLTISDGVSQGTRVDTAGDWLCEHCALIGTVERKWVADEVDHIVAALQTWVDQGIEIILTTGGTGLGPRDVTPEATRLVLHKEVPGIAEALRQASLPYTPYAMLSRGLAGISGATLIVNLPGSPRAVEQLYPLLEPIFAHARNLLAGQTSHEK